MATIFRDENVYRVTPKIVVIHFNHNHDKPGRLRGTLLTLLCLSHIPLDPTYQEQTDLKSEPTQQFHKLYPAEAFLLLSRTRRNQKRFFVLRLIIILTHQLDCKHVSDIGLK